VKGLEEKKMNQRGPTYLWGLLLSIHNNGALFSCHILSGSTLRRVSFVRVIPHEVGEGEEGCCAGHGPSR
jgi:hypothetical protein